MVILWKGYIMKRLVQKEIEYFLKSKIIAKFILILVIGYSAVLLFELAGIINLHSSYEKYLDFYLEQGVDINNENYTIQENESGMLLVDNPLAYTKEKISKFLYALSPEYRSESILELSCLIFPIAFGALGAYIMSYDYKFKTFKMKVCSSNKTEVFFSKQIAMFLIAVIIWIVAFILTWIIGEVFFYYACSHVSSQEFLLEYSFNSSVFLQIAHSTLVAFIYLEIGALLGEITLSMWPSVLISVVYLFVVPTVEQLSMIDVREAINYFGVKIYQFMGIFSIKSSLSNGIAACVLLSSVVVFVPILAFYIFKRRSAYN